MANFKAVHSGKFRITVEGFRVVNQIPDSYSSVGDRGDNVYISVERLWLDPSGKPQYMLFNQQTSVYGDLFTATGRHENIVRPNPVIYAGKNGKGLKDGEEVPYSEPWIRKARPSRDRLPLLVDEMEFTTDSGMAYIPSIWTWYEKKELHLSWQNDIRDRIGESSRNIFRAFEHFQDKSEKSADITREDYFLESSSLGLPVLKVELSDKRSERFYFAQPRTRPIGMIAADDVLIFNPKVIVFNSISAQACATTDQGFGKGVLAIAFKDGISRAEYVLYLKIEKP